MLISFSVANFRSIKEKQTIDMSVATKYHAKLVKENEQNKEQAKTLENNFFATKNETAPTLLKTASIYGANASGKSNLIKAVDAFKYLALKTSSERGESIAQYEPFELDETNCSQPTEFEIDFIAAGKRYVYGFGYDKKKIHWERLEFYQDSKKTLIYEIKLNKKNKLEENFIAEHFKGKNESALNILKNTESKLFLPLNVNMDGNQFLNPVYDWIKQELFIEASHNNIDRTTEWIEQDEKNKKNVVDMLKKSDFGIVDVEIEKKDLPEDLKKILNDKDVPLGLREHLLRQRFKTTFTTKTGHSLKPSQISLGTQALFSFCGVIFPILEKGGVLFFDELDQRLHPDLLVHIVKMFHNPKANKGNGQIIFTAHNDILLERDLLGKDCPLLRRDQIWFVNKNDKTQATELYSLVAFPNVRPRDNITDRYRDYDFGARPSLKEFRWQ